MIPQRWTFTDLATSEVWRLPRNPRRMGSIHGPRRGDNSGRDPLTGVVRITRSPTGGFEWSFEGRIHSELEYDTFLSWSKRSKVRVTDHLGRAHLVIPKVFEPTSMLSGDANPWLHAYTFKTLYLGRA